MSDTKKSAIVVLRHGCDGGTAPSNEILDFNPDVTVSSHCSKGTIQDNKVTVVTNWLGGLGLKQSQVLATALPSLLSNYCPVSRILSEGPGDGHHGTPNPVKTISYFVKSSAAAYKQAHNKNLSLDLYDNGAYKDTNVFSINALLKDGIGQFSTVVSWEALGMWRHEDGDFQKDSILGQLGHCGPNGEKVNNYDLLKSHSPYKGQIIYIFEVEADGSLTLRVYNFNPDAEGNKFNEITNGAAWPQKLCGDDQQKD